MSATLVGPVAPTVCVSCHFQAAGRTLMTQLVCRWSDGTNGVEFSFYDDELTFSANQFVGKTHAEISKIYHDVDVAYLQKP